MAGEAQKVFEIYERDLPFVRTRQALLAIDLQNDLVSTGCILPVEQPPNFVEDTVKFADVFRETGTVIWVKSQFEEHRPVNGSTIDDENVITDSQLPGSELADGLPSLGQLRPSKNFLNLYDKMMARNGESDGLETEDTEGNGKELEDGDEDDNPPAPYDNETFLSIIEPGQKQRCVLPTTLGANFTQAVVDSLNAPKDLIFTKSHYSAFKSGKLLQILRGRFVTQLFICGALTNISVYATAMDAARYGFSITLVSDCLGYRSKARHDETLRLLDEATGCDIFDSSQIIHDIRSKQRISNKSKQPVVRKAIHNAKGPSQLHEMMGGLALKNAPVPSELTADKAEETSSGAAEGIAPLKTKPAIESQESFTSVSDDSLQDNISAHKHETEAKKRVPSKIKARRRIPKIGINDEANAKSPADAPKHNLVPLSPTKKVLSAASEALKKMPIIEADDTLAVSDRETLEIPHVSGTPPSIQAIPITQSIQAVIQDTTTPSSTKQDVAKSVLPINGVDSDKSESHPVEPQANDTICEGDTQIIQSLLSEKVAESIFERVRDEVLWQNMSHQGGDVPRLVAVQGVIAADGSIPIYRHPADESPPLLPFSPAVIAIKQEVENQLGHEVNHCLIQFYRTGTDYISEHSDKTLDISPDSFIANVSLGAQRSMTFRTKKPIKDDKVSEPIDVVPRLSHKAPLPHNSLCKMGLVTNMRWLHSIRQDKRRAGEKTEAELAFDGGRISLTFRKIATYLTKDERKIWGQGAVAKHKMHARPVINGQTPESDKMLWAFGKENHATEFDWVEVYGQGFDVLHISNTRKLFSTGDTTIDSGVKAMLAEYDLAWDVGKLSPSFNWKDGQSIKEAVPQVKEAFPLKFVDNDDARTTVQGEMAILLYLHTIYGPSQKLSRSQTARQLTRFCQVETLLQEYRADPFSIQKFRHALAAWEVYASEDEFIAGPAISVVDFAFWPVLHLAVIEWGNRIKSPPLEAYHTKMLQRVSIQKDVPVLKV